MSGIAITATNYQTWCLCNLDRQTYIFKKIATLLVTHKWSELYWSLKQLLPRDWSAAQKFLWHRTILYRKETLKMLGNNTLCSYLTIWSAVEWMEWEYCHLYQQDIANCPQNCSLSAAITLMEITEGSGGKDQRRLKWKGSFGPFTSICL